MGLKILLIINSSDLTRFKKSVEWILIYKNVVLKRKVEKLKSFKMSHNDDAESSIVKVVRQEFSAIN